MFLYFIGLSVVIAVICLIVLRVYISSGSKCTLDNRLDGKVVIITGGNSGIGLSTGLELARRGARLIIGCRNKIKGEAAVKLIKDQTQSDSVHYLSLDLSSLQSVYKFTDIFVEQYGSAYALINNAAYMGPKSKSVDGYDLCFQVNYLSHYYLTQLLIHRTKPDKTRPLRVINLASDSYRSSSIDFEDLLMENEPYDAYKAYGRTKLALIWFTNELNYRYWDSAVTSVPVHPGAVRTNLLHNWPGIQGNVLRLASGFLFRSPEIGCQTVVYAAVVDSIEDFIGKILYDCKPIPIEGIGKDHRKAERLWEISWGMCPLEDLVMKKH